MITADPTDRLLKVKQVRVTLVGLNPAIKSRLPDQQIGQLLWQRVKELPLDQPIRLKFRWNLSAAK